MTGMTHLPAVVAKVKTSSATLVSRRGGVFLISVGTDPSGRAAVRMHHPLFSEIYWTPGPPSVDKGGRRFMSVKPVS